MFDIHLGNELARTPISVTYNRIHAQPQDTERGPGGRSPKKIFVNHALRIAGKCLLSFAIYSRLVGKRDSLIFRIVLFGVLNFEKTSLWDANKCTKY